MSLDDARMNLLYSSLHLPMLKNEKIEQAIHEGICTGQSMSNGTSHLDNLWEQTLDILRNKVNRPAYELFLKRIAPISLADSTLYLQLPATLSMEYFNDYNNLIQDAVRTLTNEDVRIVARQEQARAPQPPVYVPTPQPAPVPQAQHQQQRQRPFLNPRYTFDNFVVGANNRLCHAASLAVAEAPGKAYNPLFIYGGVGLGKTHLMQAVGHYVLSTRPNLSLQYITTDAFVNQVITSIQENRLFEFSSQFKRTDVLLVDDIQFLQGKERTQYEFFQIFNSLHEAHKQIVITCDRLPKDIPTLEDRLASRLGWGLIADIKPPDYETRLAILQNKARSDRVEVPEGVLELVAETVNSNIRDLEGTLNRIIAYSNLSDKNISIDLVEKILRDIAPMRERGPVTPDDIIKAVCVYFNLDVEDIKGKRRKKEIVLPRRIAMFLCRELTTLSLQSIGTVFAKDHSTVLYSCDKLKKEAEDSADLKQAISIIKGKISIH